MAPRIRADQNASESGKDVAKERAEAHFKPAGPSGEAGTGLTDAPAAAPPTVLHANVATDDDIRRMFTQVEIEDRDYEGFLTDQRTEKTERKTKHDKVWTDAAAALGSLGITKEILAAVLKKKKRKSTKVRDEMVGEIRVMRAIGMELGKQLGLFEDGFDTPDEALRRAEMQGHAAFIEKKHETDNPFDPGSPPGQRWIAGHRRAGTESLMPVAKDGEATH